MIDVEPLVKREAEADWEERLAKHLEGGLRGPLMQRRTKRVEVCVWPEKSESDIEALLTALENGISMEEASSDMPTIIEAIEHPAAHKTSPVGPPSEVSVGPLGDLQEEVMKLTDVDEDSVAQLITCISSQQGMSAAEYISSQIASEGLKSRFLSAVKLLSLMPACPVRPLTQIDLKLEETEPPLETDRRLECPPAGLLISDSSRLTEAVKHCKEILTLLPHVSVSASDVAGLASGMELNALVVQCGKLIEGLQVAGLVSPIAHGVLQHSKDWASSKAASLPVLLDPESKSPPVTMDQLSQIGVQTNRLQQLRAWLVLAIHLNQIERLALHLHGNSKTKGLLKKKPASNQQVGQ